MTFFVNIETKMAFLLSQVVTSPAPNLADNRWHFIDIRQTGPQRFTLLVDGLYSTVLLFPVSRNTLDLKDLLYIGGVPTRLQYQLPSTIVSKKGFSGCVATVVINGRLVDLLTETLTQSRYVTAGCTGNQSFLM